MIAVIRYNAGNVQSVMNTLSRFGAKAVLTDDPDVIRDADKVIFPGVGEAGSAMRYLNEHGLSALIRSLKQPFLGICLGMQLMCSFSEEGNTECLGIFPETIHQFPKGQGFKVPHMGWNTISNLSSPIFTGLENESYVYFVHSFYVPLSSYTTAETEYGGIKFTSALSRGNFHGVQFHPEKSGDCGMEIIRAFLEEL